MIRHNGRGLSKKKGSPVLIPWWDHCQHTSSRQRAGVADEGLSVCCNWWRTWHPIRRPSNPGLSTMAPDFTVSALLDSIPQTLGRASKPEGSALPTARNSFVFHKVPVREGAPNIATKCRNKCRTRLVSHIVVFILVCWHFVQCYQTIQNTPRGEK